MYQEDIDDAKESLSYMKDDLFSLNRDSTSIFLNMVNIILYLNERIEKLEQASRHA